MLFLNGPLAFCFTRGGGDSLQYYYTDASGYNYGGLIASYPGALTPCHGLAMRCYGRMRAVDATYWGYQAWLGHDTTGLNTHGIPAKARNAGVGTDRVLLNWPDIWQDSGSAFDFSRSDPEVAYAHTTLGCEIIGLLAGTPGWVSSRVDTIWVPATESTSGYFRYDSGSCPPKFLERPAQDDGGNYWYDYVKTVVEHFDSIHVWEIWNEPNDTSRFWKVPKIYYYIDDRAHDVCSLYARLCVVAESAISSVRPDDTVLIGSLVCMQPSVHCRIHPAEMLGYCYQYGQGGGWDGLAAHYYTDPEVGFVPSAFEAYAETLRTVMRDNSDFGGLWLTETGRSVNPDTSEPARYLCEAFTAAAATGALPQGGYDAACYYCFREDFEHYGVLDATDDTSRPAYYAACQTASALTGKRFNRRVMMGDGRDDTVRVYEFEDTTTSKRTWVCWRSAPLSGTTVAELPARADTLARDSLAYDDTQEPEPVYADAAGWRAENLSERPVFITDSGAVARPELVVDSFWLSGQLQSGFPITYYVRIKNRDTQRSTPESCVTWVRITWNGDSICAFGTERVLGPGDTVNLGFPAWVPLWVQGEGLLKADVNPGMLYVEMEGTDDNQSYKRLTARRGPSGGIDIVVPPLCKTGASLLPIGLTSHSWERDTTGATPADSARILFAWYGQKDTVVHATDTTAWFPFCPDTALVFPHGCGKYKVFAQFRDSGENDSPFYPDSTDSIIIFDSVPPTGNIVINEGARFAPSSTCTLALAAFDSASGVGWMRFMNRPRADLVSNGGFLATAGSWGFTNGAYDTSLQMAALSAGAVQAKVRQLVPAETISAYSGDSCVLEASILVHVHDGDATGDVSFWFWSTRQDTSLHDTLWELVDSASYSGDLLSLAGRYNLSARFLLETPTPESGWVWRGGMVRVQAHGVDGGVGDVWTDNVALNAFEPGSSYAWWGAFDTLAEWDIGSGAGEHVINALFLDSAGVENATPFADTIILDPTAPVVNISVPDPGQIVSGTVEVTGWAYDPVEVSGDTWFESRRLSYKHVDSTNWLPVDPDSVSYEPAYPDSQSVLGPAVHLGYWNTFSVPDGAYYVLLTGADSAGHVSSCTTWVIVSNEGGGGEFCGGPEGGGSGLGEGSVFVGSATGTVLHLSDDLDSLDCFQVTDSGSQAYVTAILEVGSDSLLVLDAYGKRIHKLHKGGQNRRRLVSNLSQPAGLTRDDNGNFWLVDKGVHRIGKFRSNGTLVFIRGGLGADSLHFHSPEGIAVKGSLVYVADTKNDRIAIWDTSGNYQATITGDFESPNAVMVTDSGSIYLTDGNDGRLKGITPLGGNIVTISASDSSKLRGLVLSQNKHNLFSLAPQPNKVYKLRIQSDDSMPGGAQSSGKLNLPKTLSLAQPFPNPARTRLNIAYALPRQTRVVLKLYDVAGKLVTTLANGEQKPGYYNLTWNRQDAKGRSCACGVYFCALAAENQRFCRKVILTD